MTADDDLRRALDEYRADPINAKDRPESWEALDALLDACDAALATRSEPRAEGLREAAQAVVDYQGMRSTKLVLLIDALRTALAATPPAEGLMWYRRESDGHLLYGQLIGAADAARLAATPPAEAALAEHSPRNYEHGIGCACGWNQDGRGPGLWYSHMASALAATPPAEGLDPRRLADAITAVETDHPELEPGIVGLEWEKAVAREYAALAPEQRA